MEGEGKGQAEAEREGERGKGKGKGRGRRRGGREKGKGGGRGRRRERNSGMIPLAASWAGGERGGLALFWTGCHGHLRDGAAALLPSSPPLAEIINFHVQPRVNLLEG